MGNEQQSNRSNRGQFQSFQPSQPRNYPTTNNLISQPTTTNERPPTISNLNNTNNRFPNQNIQRQPLYQQRDYERPYAGRPSNPYDSYYQNNPSSSTQNTNLTFSQNTNLANQQKLPQNSLNNNQKPKVVNQLDKPKENNEKAVSDIDRVISGVIRPEKKKEVFRGNLVEIFLFFFCNKILCF